MSNELQHQQNNAAEQFPNDQAAPDGDGSLEFTVSTQPHADPEKLPIVVVNFNKKVAWFGMSGNDAIELAELLFKHGRNAGADRPLTIAP
jgi:hypothetical protein